MELSYDLLRSFAKITNDQPDADKEKIVYGTMVKQGSDSYVRLDGTSELTPVWMTADAKDGDRVMLMVKNHSVAIIGNISSPTRTEDYLKAKFASIETLESNYAKIEHLEANYATLNQLVAVDAKIDNLDVGTVTAEYLKANMAEISELVGKHIMATDLDAKYAQIDLSNVTTQNVANLFVEVGLISDATIVNGHITGYLDSVSVNANSIKAGTLSVDRLVLNGTEESLIFALNNLGELTSTHCDTLDGGLITEKTITAEHIVAGTITAREIAAGTLTADVMDVKNVAAGIGKFVEIDAKQITSGYIEAVRIKAGSITADLLSTDAIKSKNYVKDTSGTFLDLNDGTWDSKNFAIGADGTVTLVNAKVAGSIYAQDGVYLAKKDFVINCGGSFKPSSFTKILYYRENKSQTLSYDELVCGDSLKILGGLHVTSSYREGTSISIPEFSLKVTGNMDVSGSIYEGGAALSSKYLKLSGGPMTGSPILSNGIFIRAKDSSGSASNIIGINSSNNIHVGYSDTKYPLYLHGDGRQIGFANDGFYPSDTNAVTLGSASKLWKAVYATALYEGTTALSSKYAAASHSHSYLPLAGGTLTGVLTANAGINTKANIVSSVTQSTEFHISCNWKDGSAHNLVARNNDGLTAAFGWVGSASYATVTRIRGRTVQYQNSSGTTALSDERLKNSFKPLDEFDAVYMDIEPCAFRYNDGSSGRYHFGAKAQGVKAAFEKHGFTTKDFGGFVQMQDSPENEDYCGVEDPMGLIYTEFTMWNMHMAQKALQKIADLEAEVQLLKARVVA